MKINTASLTDVGYYREKNEDTFVSKDFGDGVRLMLVCDGLGGRPHGEIASMLAVSMFVNEFQMGDRNNIPDLINRAVDVANETVFHIGNEVRNYTGMGCTMTGIVAKNGLAYIFNIGDSRSYLVRDEKITQLTEDDNIGTRELKNGIKGYEYYGNEKNLLTKTIGSSFFVEADITLKRLHVDDRLMLCSDGLYNMVPDPTMLGVLLCGNAERTVRDLGTLALRFGGNDNITVIVADVHSDRAVALSE
jgi:serine/threonine protein phosphatase PrpC